MFRLCKILPISGQKIAYPEMVSIKKIYHFERMGYDIDRELCMRARTNCKHNPDKRFSFAGCLLLSSYNDMQTIFSTDRPFEQIMIKKKMCPGTGTGFLNQSVHRLALEFYGTPSLIDC